MWLITTACSMPLPMEATFTGSAGNSMQPVKRRNIFVLISSAGMQQWQYVQRTCALLFYLRLSKPLTWPANGNYATLQRLTCLLAPD